MARQKFVIEFVDDERSVISTHVLEGDWLTIPCAQLERYVINILREFPNAVTFNFKEWTKY